MLHSFTSFYVPFQVIQKKIFHLLMMGECPLLLRYLCFMSMSLSWLHFCSSLVGVHLRLGFITFA